MTTAVQAILRSFEKLADPDKRAFATEVMRRYLHLELPPLSDQDLVENAEELFSELDRREEGDARAQQG